jgi:MFS-type transporter involved in bile tolerance (Atg22 family)
VAISGVANLVGVCMGSSQSAGRALVGYLSPPAHTAEFFGLWGLTVKLSAILGPVTYGSSPNCYASSSPGMSTPPLPVVTFFGGVKQP